MLKNKKIVTIISIISIAIIGGIFYYWSSIHTPKSSAGQTAISTDSKKIDLSPATEEDKTRADQNKEEIVNKHNQTSEPASGKRTVTPVITYAGTYGSSFQVGGFVDAFEEGGTCTATLTKGLTKVTKSLTAVRGANSVNCPEIDFPLSSLPDKGTYTLTLTYSSDTASGTSASQNVAIQ